MTNSWIDVRERLPEGRGRVLVCVKKKFRKYPSNHGNIRILTYYPWRHVGFGTAHWGSCETVTHWMPLPGEPW